MFYFKTKDLAERSKLISYMKDKDIQTVFHYIPLHSAPAGMQYGEFRGEDKYTTKESERLLRLPMHYALSETDVMYTIKKIHDFYR